MLIVIVVLYCVLTNVFTMADDSRRHFFHSINGNLTKITWAHAVNNKTNLEQTLSSNVMMIEADVVIGTVDGKGDKIPIMGHPPATQSDISLETFLFTINEYNIKTNNPKGVKLDFKTIQVFENSSNIIQKYEKVDYPLWINADIIAGPFEAHTEPVDADRFLNKVKFFKNSILSLGWTTNYSSNSNVSNIVYTNDQISAMLSIIDKYDIEQEITFSVRAGIAAESRNNMKKLVENVTNSTLTIWSSPGDIVNIANLRNLIFEIGLDRIYIDVPKEVLQALHLDKSSGANFSTFRLFISIATAILLYYLSK